MLRNHQLFSLFSPVQPLLHMAYILRYFLLLYYSRAKILKSYFQKSNKRAPASATPLREECYKVLENSLICTPEYVKEKRLIEST